MNEEEIIKLNTKRLQLQLAPLKKQLDKTLLNYYKGLQFYLVNKGARTLVDLNDIDFNQSLIFLSDENVLPYISMFALQKLSGVKFPDTTLAGRFSRIKIDYILTESNEMRYIGKTNYFLDEDDEVSDIYKPTYFYDKPLAIWRFGTTVAGNHPEYMFDYCCERVYERYLRGLHDWIFFQGTRQQFDESYTGMLSSIPIFEVSSTVPIPEDHKNNIVANRKPVVATDKNGKVTSADSNVSLQVSHLQ